MCVILDFSRNEYHPTIFKYGSEISLNLQFGFAQNNTAHFRCNAFGRGVNLSNWLEAHWLGNDFPDKSYFTKLDIAAISALGFNSVRLPVTFERVFRTVPPYDIMDENHILFEVVDSVISWTDEYGLKLIIDNHHGWALNNDNYLNEIPRLESMWLYLINKYQDLNKERVFFELRNEPNDISSENLHTVFEQIIQTLRTTDIDFTFVVGTNDFNSFNALLESEPYQDDNLIYSFHFYEPYAFTHQGLSWTELPTGEKFAESDWNNNLLKLVFQKLTEWSYEHNAPIMVGELGVGAHADLNSRCNWISSIMNGINEYHIPWFYWDIKKTDDSFGFFMNDDHSIDQILPCFGEAMNLTSRDSVSHSCHGNSLIFYPNPSSGEINLEIEGLSEIRIYDLQGKLLKLLRAHSNTFYTNLSDLPDRAYILQAHFFDRFTTVTWLKITH